MRAIELSFLFAVLCMLYKASFLCFLLLNKSYKVAIKKGKNKEARRMKKEKVVGEKIKSAVEFLGKVKEVETLVKSVDELAKAIGKKIQNDDTLGSLQDKNGSLLAGVHSVVSSIKTKLEALEQTVGVSDELKKKVSTVKTESKSFLDKLKEGNAELGIEGATDENAKKAIDRIGKNDGDKGVVELLRLNKVVDELVISIKAEVDKAVKELTSSVKSEPVQSSN
ncbi:vsp protein (plasmid) [Borrelia duttonii Ly]|uniref:Vsp protein n=2 Tax=Borrelia duttonii TaxID=40834 RepID=B5RP25_BORDL|nr:vsp protein [Borrelia duttonii Ly]